VTLGQHGIHAQVLLLLNRFFSFKGLPGQVDQADIRVIAGPRSYGRTGIDRTSLVPALSACMRVGVSSGCFADPPIPRSADTSWQLRALATSKANVLLPTPAGP